METMRYKIEYSRTRTDRWGHILPSPSMRVEWAATLEEARSKALCISKAFKKWDVNVLDKKGPKLDEEDVAGATTWGVCGYLNGRLIDTNDLYFSKIGR